jgi:hypothetical protein
MLHRLLLVLVSDTLAHDNFGRSADAQYSL